MRTNIQSYILFRQIAAYFLLSRTFEVAASPAPQGARALTTAAPTPVTVVATGTDGKVVTGNLLPTNSTSRYLHACKSELTTPRGVYTDNNSH